MPKVYFCRQEINSEICGETNPENFEVGRYSSCRKCRAKYHERKRKTKKEEVIETSVEILDPLKNIRYVIEDTVRRIPLLEGQTIPDKILNIDADISELVIANSELKEKMNELFDYIKKLELEIQLLKKIN